MSANAEVLLADEAPIIELDELGALIAEGQERGFLTIEQITALLEEVDVTKEQVRELHAHLYEQGIDDRRRRRQADRVGGRENGGGRRGAQGDGGAATAAARRARSPRST